jgi:hypothetical protein
MTKLDQLMSEMKLDPSTHLVPTNVPGVFSKVRTPGNCAKSSSIASLIHSNVLTGLMESDSPVRWAGGVITGGPWD